MLQAIVQPLVVAVVEPLLLKFPLEIPVGFCDEQDLRISIAHGSDEFDPIFPPRFLACAGSPRPLEDGIHHEHGHVATHPVALFGNGKHRCGGSLAQRGTERIELSHILPRREIRIPAVRDDRTTRLEELPRFLGQIARRALNEILRMIHDPRMVWRNVVRNEIKDQSHAAIGQHLSGCRQAVGPAKLIVHDIPTDTVGRSCVVLRLIVR